ncbi:MAG: hypothetical protein ABWX85_14870, partial [Arthrobacter sp.]
VELEGHHKQHRNVVVHILRAKAHAGTGQVLQVQRDTDNDGAGSGVGGETGAAGEEEAAVAPSGKQDGGPPEMYEVSVS